MKNKVIVTTTINPPTEATLKFSKMTDWHLVVVGDTKTPHADYKNLTNTTYLSPEDQEKLNKKLSDAIGWKSIRRRNMGYLQAYNMGAEIMATVDDYNIPLEGWGKKLIVGNELACKIYNSTNNVFDPLSVTEHKELWHRGYPLQLVPEKNDNISVENGKVQCLVQADLWNGDPDIDAVCRLTKAPNIKFKKLEPFSVSCFSPFNSQNTFIHRSLIPHYMVIPHIGRMDDIWGAYELERKFLTNGPFVVYNNASVYQDRNEHDLIVDMEEEMIGYKYNLKLLSNGLSSVAPKEANVAYKIYQSCYPN